MNGAAQPSNGEESAASPDGAMLRVALGLVAAYLLATMVPMVHWLRSTSSVGPLVGHMVMLAAALKALWPGRAPTRLRGWMPLLFGPILYVELRWIIAAAGFPHADPTVVHWEQLLFSSDPSRTMASPGQSRLVSELLHLCYLSYYAIVYFVPAVLWRRSDGAFEFTVVAIVVTYTICFVTFIFFPVDGPRFLHGPAPVPDGVVRDVVRVVLDRGSSLGTAFPSAHVAASLVAGLCALRYRPPIGWCVLALVAGLALGAVYGGYHYGVDVLAGAATALLAYGGARAIEAVVRVPIAAPQVVS